MEEWYGTLGEADKSFRHLPTEEQHLNVCNDHWIIFDQHLVSISLVSRSHLVGTFLLGVRGTVGCGCDESHMQTPCHFHSSEYGQYGLNRVADVHLSTLEARCAL